MPASPNSPLIREATPDDWPQIAQLLDRPPSDAQTLRRWTQSEYSPPITLVLQESDQNPQVIGAAVAGLPRTSSISGNEGGPEPPARLSFLGIAPRHRRRGYARLLLDALIRELRSYHARRLSTVVEGTQIGRAHV